MSDKYDRNNHSFGRPQAKKKIKKLYNYTDFDWLTTLCKPLLYENSINKMFLLKLEHIIYYI